MSTVTDRTAEFRRLHQQGCFVIPNPWDRGSAVLLAGLGFPALATSSAGFGFTRGRPDSPLALTRDEVLAHVADIVRATGLPVTADYQTGYADDAAGVARNVALCLETGVAGLSIEDASGDPTAPLYELERALERVQAARHAIDQAGSGALLTARAECYLTGHEKPLEEALRRLVAFAEAGADVLFAPGVREPQAIRLMVEAVAPRPVNVLISGRTELRVSDLEALGVRRVSVGSALARCAWTAAARAARDLAETGGFTEFEGILSTADVSQWFPQD